MRITTIDLTESTNQTARSWAATAGAREPHAFIARRQTAGRGRLGRPWLSPRGAVALTLARPTGPDPADDAAVPLLAALACLDAAAEIDPRLDVELAIKWPNDLLLAGRKLAGILCERMTTSSGAWVLVGVGINADVEEVDLHAAGQDAASLRTFLGRTLDHMAISHNVVSHLGRRLDTVGGPLPETAWAELNARLAYRDSEVLIAAPGREADGVTGTLRGVDQLGRAIVETEAGPQRCPSGEMSLRPTPAGAAGAT